MREECVGTFLLFNATARMCLDEANADRLHAAEQKLKHNQALNPTADVRAERWLRAADWYITLAARVLDVDGSKGSNSEDHLITHYICMSEALLDLVDCEVD